MSFGSILKRVVYACHNLKVFQIHANTHHLPVSPGFSKFTNKNSLRLCCASWFRKPLSGNFKLHLYSSNPFLALLLLMAYLCIF
jgi:hypothetical protein